MFNFNPKKTNNTDSAVSVQVNEAFDQYFSDVFRYVQYKVNDENVAEDIASETFIRLVDAAQKGKFPSEKVKGWLFVTASHVISDHYRSLYKNKETELTEEVSDHGPDLQKQSEQKEMSQLLSKNLQKLTEEQQQVLNYRFNLDYSIEDTAQIMNKNTNAIKQLQFRAVSALKKMMDESI